MGAYESALRRADYRIVPYMIVDGYLDYRDSGKRYKIQRSFKLFGRHVYWLTIERDIMTEAWAKQILQEYIRDGLTVLQRERLRIKLQHEQFTRNVIEYDSKGNPICSNTTN